jgi:hypothetical protein
MVSHDAWHVVNIVIVRVEVEAFLFSGVGHSFKLEVFL